MQSQPLHSATLHYMQATPNSLLEFARIQDFLRALQNGIYGSAILINCAHPLFAVVMKGYPDYANHDGHYLIYKSQQKQDGPREFASGALGAR